MPFATKSLIVPLDKISPEQYEKMVTALLHDVEGEAATLIAGKTTIIRELKPSDLGLSTDEWTFTLNAGENTIVSGYKLPDDTMIVIYEVFNLSTNPVATEVKFGTPAGDKVDVFIEDLYMYDRQAGMLLTPVKINPGQTPVIKVIAKAAGTEKIGFKGFVIEPAGKTINA